MIKSDKRNVIFILALALTIRLVYFFCIYKETFFLYPIVDSTIFHNQAIKIASGNLIGKDVFTQSPFYSYWLGLIYSIFGPHPIFAEIIQFILGIFNCILLYYLGKLLFSQSVGLLSAIFATLYSMTWFYEGSLLTPTIILTLNLGMLLCIYKISNNPNWKMWFFPGILLGLSTITRPNVILITIFLFIWIIFYYPKSFPLTKKYLSLIFLSLGILVCILPVTIRNVVVLKEMLITVPTGGINFYIGNSKFSMGFHYRQFGDLARYPATIAEDFKKVAEEKLDRSLTYSEASRFWYKQAWLEIAQDPYQWIKLLLKKALLFLNYYEITSSLNINIIRERIFWLHLPWLSFGIICPWALLGLFLHRSRWQELLPLYGIVFTYLFFNVFFLVSAEYRIAVVPVFLLLGSSTFLILLKKMLNHFGYDAVQMIIVLLLLGLLCHLQLLSPEVLKHRNAAAYLSLGAMNMRIKAYHQAAYEYEEAWQLFPNNLYNAEHLAEALVLSEQYKKALPILAKVLELTPDNLEILDIYASVLAQLEGFQQSLPFRLKAVKLDPKNPKYYYNLGITYLWLERDNEATKAFNQAVRLDPNLDPMIKSIQKKIIMRRVTQPTNQ